MTDGEGPEIAPISWCDAEPARFQRDKAEVEALFPDLIFVPPGRSHADVLLPHGGWYGVLPIWPFERAQPDGVEGLVGGTGLEFVLEFLTLRILAEAVLPLFELDGRGFDGSGRDVPSVGQRQCPGAQGAQLR